MKSFWVFWLCIVLGLLAIVTGFRLLTPGQDLLVTGALFVLAVIGFCIYVFGRVGLAGIWRKR